MNGEQFSELQAVDFALGAFIAGAFTDLAESGTKEWKEFLRRSVSRKVYRHDADDPQEFLRNLLASRKAEKTTPGTLERKNMPELPVVYYFRKPGLTNSENNKPNHGKTCWNEALTKAFNLMAMPVSLDYQLFLVAWDKPTLDKMQLAYYAWQTRHDKFNCLYGLATAPVEQGGQPGGDVLEASAYIQDHRTITFTNSSIVDKEHRLYAVMMPISLNTQVLSGVEVVPPEFIEFEYGSGHLSQQQHSIGTCDGVKAAFSWSTQEDKSVITARVFLDGQPFAIWYSAGWRYMGIDDYVLGGSVDQNAGEIVLTIDPPPAAGELTADFGLLDCPGYF